VCRIAELWRVFSCGPLLWMACAMALTGAACATELAARAKTVGVLVLAGDQLEVARIGMTVFGNKRVVVAAPDGAMTQLAFDEIRAELDLEQRFEIRQVPVQRDDRVRLAKQGADASQGVLGPQWKLLAVELAPYRKACACDALLVALPAYNTPFYGSNQSAAGFWWAGYSRFSEDVHHSSAIVNLWLLLVDPATGDVVASGMAAAAPWGWRVPPEHWPKSTDEVPADAWPVLYQAFRGQLPHKLRHPLYEVGLRPSCTMYFLEMYPVAQTPDAFPPDPPQLPAGADPAKCEKLPIPKQRSMSATR